MSAAAQDIPKFFPKVDLQADYSTAKVRGSPGGREGSRRGSGGKPTAVSCVFQSVLGAGYQALWLARALLAGQELMLRGLYWFV